MTMHDLIHEKYPHFFEDASQITNAKKLAIRRSAHVICVSESTRRDLINFFDVAPERTSVIHLGFSLTPPARASLEENRISEKPFFLFVGNRGTYKNFARLVQAFASSSALRGDFDLVAFGGSGFSHDEGELLSRLGVANSVKHVTGNDARLAACYRAATAFVFPSLYEGFGIPPLEAMSFGCPVACSASSSIPEVVCQAAAFFDPESVESIRASLESLVDSSALRAELVLKGRERLKLFSWDRCAERTASVYKAALERTK